ncbi:MAG: electron transfer flavoprotein subunit alpha, partial [Enterobacterales bacterium]|nr:electron transfer flavoprotein subunit alpha [Enterobacterales bacterium]
MSKFATVWVFSDTHSHLPELIGGARELGEIIHV